MLPLDYKRVTSSRLTHVAWANNQLWVIFTDGTEGHYEDCPESVYFSMMNAYSKGKFLNEFVIGQYTWVPPGSKSTRR
ncbi:MAG: hypothetical protein C0467_31160 [Planctomycetaceae bacterium]|nr:hypothetical protein [Planctomycetaceae bacterium]